MQKLKNLLKRGDTLIEVSFAISIFSLVSIITMQVMDRDVAQIQGALETEMARNEIDAQAEALRFIQNAFLSERELAASEREYQDLWLKLSRGPGYSVSTAAGTGLANNPENISLYTSTACSAYYDKANSGTIHNIFSDRAFVLNTRNINPDDVNGTVIQSSRSADASKFNEAGIYPRLIFSGGSGGGTSDTANLSEIFPSGSSNLTYRNQWKYAMSGSRAVLDSSGRIYSKVARAEGIWVVSARDMTKGESATPEFFDFHIRTCWFAPGHDRPSTIATTIRLYNPEYIEDQK